jgi:hypothetical protein
MGVAEDIINAKLKKPGANELDINKAQREGASKKVAPKRPPTPEDEMNKGVVGIVRDWFKRQKINMDMLAQGKNYKVPKKGK